MNTLIIQTKDGCVDTTISLTEAEAYIILDAHFASENDIVSFVLLDYSGDIITQGERT